MDRLVNQLASPPPPPMPQLDPYATMWKRIDALPIGPKDKVAVGNYLGRQENEGARRMRGCEDFLLLLVTQL